MAKRTITLTGRPPVSIEEDNWPVIASAADKEHDGQVESQANRLSTWSVKVREHEDSSRAIVYAVYGYTTHWRSERNYCARRGVLLSGGATAQQICAVIRQVCDDIAQAEHADGDADRWPTLAAECIADMPAEELA